MLYDTLVNTNPNYCFETLMIQILSYYTITS